MSSQMSNNLKGQMSSNNGQHDANSGHQTKNSNTNASGAYNEHSFKNRTGPDGPTGSTENRPSVRSGYGKKPEIGLKPINSKNRPV